VGPVFVLGGQRTGTTLLRLMLDAHPQLAIGPESGFLRAVKDTVTIRDFQAGEGWFERFGVSRDWLTTRLAGLYDELFSTHAAAQGKPYWGEKTPMHTWHVDLARELYPQARFVGVVRHPAAVATSATRWGHELGFAAAAWAEGVHRQLRDRDAHGADVILLLRYEDLLADAEATMRDVLAHVGLPWSDAVLRHHEIHAQRDGGGADGETDGGTRPADPIDRERADAWRTTIDPDDLGAIMAATQPWAGLLGYGPDGTAPTADAMALRPGALAAAGYPPAPTTSRQQAEHGWQQRLHHQIDDLKADAATLRSELASLQRERDAALGQARDAARREADAVANYDALNNRRFVRIGRRLLDRN